MTVMGEALVDGLSDAGSTPARSTEKSLNFLRNQGIGRFLCTFIEMSIAKIGGGVYNLL